MTPQEYEVFVAELTHAIAKLEDLTENYHTIEIQKVLQTKYGLKRWFDIYWEYEIDGEHHKAIIECKNYKRRVSVGLIDELIGKLTDFPGVRPIMATTKGFQSGAQSSAANRGVELLVVREQNLSDWTAEDGKALVRRLEITVECPPPAEIHHFRPVLDASWVERNSNIDTSRSTKKMIFWSPNTFIENVEDDDRYSLQELSGRLSEKDAGRHTDNVTFKDAYLVDPELGRLKLLNFTIEYSTFAPLSSRMEIDFSEALVGVIEYLQKGTKKLIFQDKVNTGDMWIWNRKI